MTRGRTTPTAVPTLPEKIRFTAFTSHGVPAGATAEAAGPPNAGPPSPRMTGFCEIIIRADFDDPLEILGILAHELVHAALPDAKHGKEFGTRRCVSPSKARCGGRSVLEAAGSV